MNTTFFQKASENKRSISWGDIFTDVWKKHQKKKQKSFQSKKKKLGAGRNIEKIREQHSSRKEWGHIFQRQTECFPTGKNHGCLPVY